MEAIIFALFGLIIGSFLNVLIIREETGEAVTGRSHCMHCKKVLSPTDLIPIISWIILRGRCRYCKGNISMQYPLVEALTASLFFLVGLSPLPLALQMLGLVIVSTCVAIAIYDVRFMLIPDLWSYVFSFSALLTGAFMANSAFDFFLLLIAGPLVASPLWALWAVSKGRWMGFGDVKFAVGIGWLLGAYNGFVALLFSFVIGALISVCILLPLPHIISYAQRFGILRLRTPATSFTMTSEVPFGPFLIASCLIVWFSTLYGIELPLPW